MEKEYPKIQRGICAVGLTLLALLFLFWLGDGNGGSAPEFLCALISLLLFAALCLRFVPRWFSLWFGAETPLVKQKGVPLSSIFAIGLSCAAVHIALIWLVLHYVNRDMTPREFADFWLSADAYHYLCIARDWYIPEGNIDRVVQLVFLPGYPIAVRLMQLLTRDYILAGITVSILSFSGALCLVYRLVLLDYGEAAALRTVAVLCMLPGAFFFTAPMSESLFLLLCAACLYSARKERWLLAGLFGALASFTRSLGLMLFAPLFIDMTADLLHGRRKSWRGLAALALVPLGFAAYCLINYLVSGDPFRFLYYQRTHWYQELGLFFNTAAYQMRYALGAEKDRLMGLWIPNLVASFASLAILFAAAKKLRADYTLWAIAYYAVAIGATWLLSAPRYLAALLPLSLSLALLGEKKALRIAIYTVLAASELYYLTMFALRYGVW